MFPSMPWRITRMNNLFPTKEAEVNNSFVLGIIGPINLWFTQKKIALVQLCSINSSCDRKRVV